MTISFDNIPTTLRVPFAYVEFNSTRAQSGSSILAYKALIIGQKLAAGTLATETLTPLTQSTDVDTLCGEGSQLALMAKAWLAANTFTECYIMALADNGAGVVADGLLTFTGPATAAGTLSLYFGGHKVEVAVANGNTAVQIAAAVEAAMTAASDLPVTGAQQAPANDHKVTITSRHKGVAQNEIDIRVNYLSSEALPAGVGLSITAMANGTTAPSLTNLIAALGDDWYNVIVHPYTDATSLAALEAELTSRFGPLRMIDGVAITASAEDHTDLGTLGNSRNSPHNCIVATNQSPTLPWEYAASVGAIVAYYAAIDPARPFQTLALPGVLPPANADLFTLSERNLLLYDGIATTKVAAGGVVQIERLITTYKTNAAGADDTAYLDANTLFTLMYLRYDFRNYFLTKYPRYKLASDGTRYGAGQAIMTPKLAKSECVVKFRQWEEKGLVEGIDQFKDELIVERNEADPNRLDIMLPPDLVNQLRVFGVQIGFLLQAA